MCSVAPTTRRTTQDVSTTDKRGACTRDMCNQALVSTECSVAPADDGADDDDAADDDDVDDDD